MSQRPDRPRRVSVVCEDLKDVVAVTPETPLGQVRGAGGAGGGPPLTHSPFLASLRAVPGVLQCGPGCPPAVVGTEWLVTQPRDPFGQGPCLLSRVTARPGDSVTCSLISRAERY